MHGLASAQARALSRAAEAASLHSFRLGIGISAALVAIGGVVGAVGIRNRSKVRARTCPGGQLVGGSEEIARAQARRPRHAGRSEAQPTGSRA